MSKRFLFILLLWLCTIASIVAAPSQTRDLNRLMRAKLEHSQKILEAVVTSNWMELEAQVRELERLTDDPRWTALKYPEYARYSLGFKRALHDLGAAAENKDLENAPAAYNTVILRCVDCHRYLARSRIAGLDR